MRKIMVVAMVALCMREVVGGTLNVPGDYETINDAAGAANAGDEIVIAKSDEMYSWTANLVIPQGVTVRGATGDRNDVLITFGGGTRFIDLCNDNTALADLTVTNATPPQRVIYLRNSKSVVRNCRIVNCSFSDYNSRGGIEMTTGLVTNCIVDSCVANLRRPHATGIVVSGGTLVDTVIRGCSIKGGWNQGTYTDKNIRGAALRVTGGTVINCQVSDNTVGTFVDDNACPERQLGLGIYASGSATIVNTTVVGNTYAGDVSGHLYGLAADSANVKVRNCVILDNGNVGGAIANIAPAAVFDHCAVAAREVLGCTDCVAATLADDLRCSADGIYAPTRNSVLKDAGKDDYVPTGITEDLVGANRIIGRHVDIGAVECQTRPGLVLVFR